MNSCGESRVFFYADGEAVGDGKGGYGGGEVIHLMEFVGTGFGAAGDVVGPRA